MLQYIRGNRSNNAPDVIKREVVGNDCPPSIGSESDRGRRWSLVVRRRRCSFSHRELSFTQSSRRTGWPRTNDERPTTAFLTPAYSISFRPDTSLPCRHPAR